MNVLENVFWVMEMKNSIKFIGMIVFFVIIFMIVVIYKIDASNKIQRSITKKDTDTISKGIDGYILLKEDTVFFIYEKNIKSDYDRKDLEQRLKWRFSADAILHINNSSIEKELQTGDKVRIGCSEILESYHAKIRVTQLEKIQD